ncbi:PDZ domain-containing protein MAGIX isoform X2 [Ochotona curzoniae]|uniref:PDZ domain-containing protein MAGIX isoform X2 n=1 Tax=Ochotona curzoniae TaxID=130825 RepID=UPI001B3530EA|nr:PDZ domain-containing protein MAGIX isoform X2 [Ochotona curzoniae]
MERRAGGASDPRGNKGGRGRSLPAGPSARQLLARLDARPLAARAAADVSALVRRAGTTLRLRAKEAVGESDSADIEVTDRRLPHVTVAEHRPQPGDVVLHVNGESTQGLSHGQVVERIRAGGPRLSLVLCRPLEMQPQKAEGTARPHKGGVPLSSGHSLVPGVPKAMRSHRSTSASPDQYPRSSTTSKTQRSPEPSPQATVDCLAMPPPRECRCSDDPDDHVPGSPGPWLVPSEERLSQALGAPGPGQLAQEVAAGRRRH